MIRRFFTIIGLLATAAILSLAQPTALMPQVQAAGDSDTTYFTCQCYYYVTNHDTGERNLQPLPAGIGLYLDVLYDDDQGQLQSFELVAQTNGLGEITWSKPFLPTDAGTTTMTMVGNFNSGGTLQVSSAFLKGSANTYHLSDLIENNP